MIRKWLRAIGKWFRGLDVAVVMGTVIGVALTAAFILVVLASVNRKTVTIPVEYCQQQYTGRTRDQAVTTYNCYGYDKNGVCTMNVPTTTYYTEKEVNVACNYSEWQQ